MLRRALTLLALPLLLLSQGCATSKPPELLTKVQVEKIRIPEPLLSCPDDPDIPDPLNDANLADYLLSLWQRGDDCGAKIGEIRDLNK